MPEQRPADAEPNAEALAFMHAYARRHPDLSARRVTNLLQKLLLVALLAAAAACFAFDPVVALILLNGVFLSFYLVMLAYKALLIRLSVATADEPKCAPAEIAESDEAGLPVYSILVPLYHEAESLPGLLRGLHRLDYPKGKLDVLWLLEEDDEETIDAARRLHLPPWVRLVRVPRAEPRTKPKACNLGLALARGEFVVIYDAEDRPEPDQLKKAVLGFRRCPERVVCLQARLNFYNQRQNLLTRWFTADYSMWFDLFLPGLDRLGAPIPLGGTSNHFKTDRLRELLGWDPYNVTEDCELGVRLALAGLGTHMIDSTTWEEACGSLRYWLRQRSRWVKGYVQTWLSHQRRPFRLLRRLGVLRDLSFHTMVGGTFVSLLINPVYWTLALLWFTFRWETLGRLFPYPLILVGLLCLFLGNFLFVYASMLAVYKRGYFDLVKHCLVVPVYWVFASIGAWWGFLQLFRRPSYWAKTPHGLDLAATADAAPPKPA